MKCEASVGAWWHLDDSLHWTSYARYFGTMVSP